MNARHRSRAWLLGPLAIVVVTSIAVAGTGATADPVVGSQGTDTAIPATESQVTVNGRGTFADLAITVNQTQKLTNQAVSITWTGGKPTVSGPGRFGSQYLQIMQCWGDDDGSVPGNPGPPPEQCEQGAAAGTYGGLPGGLYPSGLALSRVISRSDWSNFDAAVGALDTRTTNVWRPFRSVGGTVIDIPTDPTFNPSVAGGNFWLNPYFNIITTNEIAAAVTGPSGTGAELFQVLSGVQSSGLGCGQQVQPIAGGGKKIPQCWIVVVPRGTPEAENAGTPFEANATQNGVVTSPLSPLVWRNRIAIPLQFNPIDSPCALNADERRIVGSELALPAVASWQPALCSTGNAPPYSYAPVSDASARQQLVSNTPGRPGMIVVSRPLAPSSLDPKNPVVYSPISVSGLTIGFNIERNPRSEAPDAEKLLAGIRVAELNLTPRIVAKLLTQSYRQAVSILEAPPYPWVSSNPAHVGVDPDFLQFNPEFQFLQVSDSRTFSGLQLPAGNSDAAQQVWEWLLADPEARAWLDGQPDQWGMQVNPVYATSAVANAAGVAFGDPAPNSFPKGDPYCYLAAPLGDGGSISVPPLCGTDWIPYSRGYADTAQVTRAASDGARIVQNTLARSSNDVWKRDLPQFLGRRNMLALTDTPSAAQFGLQTARLSRAGDNGADRVFVAPDVAGLQAGVMAMVAGEDPTVLQPALTVSAAGAYPLTALTYAATAPLSLDAAARSEYATFLEYATSAGQVSGAEPGQLPKGYAPLPANLQTQAAAAAQKVRTMVPAAEETTTTIATTTTTASPFVPQQTPPRPAAPPTGTVPSISAAPVTTDPAPTTTTITTTTTTDPADPPVDSTPTVLTPIVSLARSRFAVPGLAIMALGSALGALEVTKRPRRRRAGHVEDIIESGEIDAR